MLLLAISDVVLVVSEGAEADFEMLRCLKRADMLKHGIPEFPLIPSEKLGLSRPEINVQPQIGKVLDCQFDNQKKCLDNLTHVKL
jgi:hypothetical protein